MKNSISLLIGHVSNYIVPFSLLFLLSRDLNEQSFSFFMYSQVVLVWSGMFIEYGFTLRAIRYLKKDNINVKELYNIVQTTKIVLSIIAFFYFIYNITYIEYVR
ncbi:hypothetical protein UB37_15730 [Photobacterium iliopiscarium]|uniref:oligosaccharide flippase family protein n=1 Tax=Photobacterium iliopiscarium TaxID=56192 RepID=UPI0005D32C8F|nr:hypothetical protein UB37_15730 [Photobacterium iliopiscarium]